MSVRLIDKDTGETVAIVIQLWNDGLDECPLCGRVSVIDHAVAYCCEPTHDEIGSMSSVYKDTEVGGMSCCKDCHDLHYYGQTHQERKQDG